MTHERPEGFDKLPKRFQDYARSLESTIDTLTAQVPARAAKGDCVCIADSLHRGNNGYLPVETQIEFRIGKQVYRVQRAKAQRGITNGIEINAELGRCIVYPDCSNVVVIGSER